MKTVSFTKALLVAAAIFTSLASVADGLGVLFTTPEQRAALDSSGDNASVIPSNDKKETTSDGPSSITLNGTLVSSVGRKEVWLNGEPSFVGRQTSGQDLQMLTKNRVRIWSKPMSSAYVLKPGQTANLGSGQVVETYSQGSIQLNPQDPN